MLGSYLSKIWNNVVYFVTTTIASYMICDQNLLISLISIDSLLSATKFMTETLTFTKKQGNDTNSFFTSSIIDRYILYGLIYVFYNTFMIFWWLDDLFIMKLLLMHTPLIIDYALLKYFLMINTTRLTLTKKIIAKMVAKIIKYFSKIYLDKIVSIKHDEILPLIIDYEKVIDYILNILKNMLIIMLLNYIKSYSSTLYFSIKKIYHYKTSEILNSFVSKDHSRELLINIINTRNWKELLKPNTFKAIMHVYQMSQNNITVSDIIIHINLNMTKFFTLWTIGSFVNINAIIPLISILILLVRYIGYNCFSRKNIIVNFIILVVSMIFPGDMMYISFMCAFGADLFLNSFTKITSYVVYKKIVKKLKMVNIYYLYEWVIIFLYMIIYKNDGIMLLGIKNGFTAISIHCIVLYTSTYISGFNIYHIMFNTIVLFICDKLCDVLFYVNGILVSCKKMIGCGEYATDVFEMNDNDFINAISVNSKNETYGIQSHIIINDYMK